jgi:tetratricopeptide (TPR) repeat protein
MRYLLMLIACLAIFGSLSPAAAQETGATAPKATDDTTALKKQLAAQAAEIKQLKSQIAAQAAEIERLKHPSADPITPSAPANTPPPAASTASSSIYDYVLAGTYPLAVGAADEAISRNPNDTEVIALKAYALAAFGSIDGARPLVAKALQATEGKTGRARALTLVAQGVVAVADGDTRAAVTAFQSAGHDDPTLGLAYIAYADLLHKVGKDEMAHKLLQAGLQEQLTPSEVKAINQKLAAL